jgi:hypothetical protein
MSTQSPSRTSSPRSSSPGAGSSSDTGTRTLGAQIGRVLGVVIALIILALLARFRGIEQDMHFKINDRVAAIDGDTLRSAFGEALVREGLAVNFGGDKRGPYAAAEADAQAAKHGIWRGTFQKPSDWRQAYPRDGN